MTAGCSPLPAGTLIERAIALLHTEPADSRVIGREVLGIPRAPDLVFERMAVALLQPDPRVRRLPDGRWDLVRDAANSPALRDCTFAVVDVETTGSRPAGPDRITEIAIVLVHGGSVTPVLDTLVNPERPIPPVVTRLTRITQADVRDKPVFAEIADEVTRELAGRVFVAHNVRFDWGFVAGGLRRTRDVVLDGPRICTVRLARRLIPGLKSRGLDSVARYFGVEIARRHRAGGDALATAEVLVRLLERAEERGVRTLRELQQLGPRQPRKRRRSRSGRSLPRSLEDA